MAPSPSEQSPGPGPTPAPAAATEHRYRAKRRRVSPQSGPSSPRQVITDSPEVEEAKTQCQVFAGNDRYSCYPTAESVYPQHQWGTFVWNSRRPELTQTNRVDIHLYRADSNTEVLSYLNQVNPTGQAGSITAQVDDRWWGTDGENWSGRNISYPFYWVIVRNDTGINGNQIRQATFTAIQTTYADSVVASMASTSSVASASSAASAASVSSVSSASAAAEFTRTRSPPTSGSPTGSAIPNNPSGNVQGNNNGDKFPDWAIAVIVVLGFLAIAASCVLAFLIMRRMRRRKQEQADSNRNSMGSASPMMANVGNNHNSPQSPLLAGGFAGAAVARQPSQHDAPSVILHDGASTISESGPFSGADAAIMAEAFRKALRKPDFASRPVEEGESPEAKERKEELLNRELAEEGRDIRSVSSSRGVRVETQSNSGDTIHDHPR